MSLALKNRRNASRAKVWWAVGIALAVMFMITTGAAGYGFVKAWRAEPERLAAQAQEIADGHLFWNYYGIWYEKFPTKYRTKLQIARQDLGLDRKDRFTSVFGGLTYQCKDAPSNWWPGDRETAEWVREDIRKESGDKIAAEWFQNWDNVHGGAVCHGWGFFTQ